jgi:nitrite reductase/ring-hydroxylating ferredoxin subunit
MLELCRLADIPDGGARGFAVEGPDLAQRIVVARLGKRIFGYVNLCPHALSRLDSEIGQFFEYDDSSHLFCDSHAALFRVEDGVCIEGPCEGQALTPAAIKLIGDRVCLDQPNVARVDEISKILSDLR